MTELSGTLQGVGLPAIVRFLRGLNKTGCLRVSHAGWEGEIFFAAGQVTSATFGSRHGLPALDALIEALPTGQFAFDLASGAEHPVDITLTPDELQAHIDELAGRLANGVATLPSLEAVLEVVVKGETGKDEDPLPLDRLMLLTLLAVDGRRTVREIVVQRGSIDALWQLGTLAQVGLVRVVPNGPGATRIGSTDQTILARLEPGRTWPGLHKLEPKDDAQHCPKLGFEDDPNNSFGRPTRLHRCFAAGAPLPLSIDHQRELCLSDQFGTCPRLGMAGPPWTGEPPRDLQAAQPPDSGADFPKGEDSRIVHLPLGGRNGASQRNGVGDRHAVGASELTQFRLPGAGTRDSNPHPPTPLRTRAERSNGNGHAAAPTTPGEPPSPPKPESRTPDHLAARQALAVEPVGGRFGGVPLMAIAALGVVFSILAVIAYLLIPYLGQLFTDDGVDPTALPNSSAVAAGGPVPLSPVVRAGQATPGARATPSSNAATGASASAASGAAAPTVPTMEPESAPAGPVAEPAAVSPVGAAPPSAALLPPGTLVDEHFSTNALDWPSNPQGPAWVTNGGYRLFPHQAGQFVAIAAPIVEVPRDVIVSARFRKLSGPPGGGFGIIMRDQSRASNDVTGQQGYFYVLEAGDKGEVGIWRREADHWVDVLPWQHSDAVHTDAGTNDLTVRAIGDSLGLSVNGTQVATRTDTTFTSGGVGLFVGGDGNQVIVEHFTVQKP